MSKYSSLSNYLIASGKKDITLTFSDIERVLGFKLPQSAYTYHAWWANGGHSQSDAWLGAGYKVERIDLEARKVGFSKCVYKSNHPLQPKLRPNAKTNIERTLPVPIDSSAKTLTVLGYQFCYLQEIIPELDARGCIVKYYPQDRYDNNKNLQLSKFSDGAFCRFSINAGDWPGVYLWVVDNRIIYIGETDDLKGRFNIGYGNISPRNCYVSGQSTNCKMNKVVLDLFEQGKRVSLFFYETTDYKRVELELLRKIVTPNNVKNN